MIGEDHPVRTSAGWISAKFLEAGDKIDATESGSESVFSVTVSSVEPRPRPTTLVTFDTRMKAEGLWVALGKAEYTRYESAVFVAVGTGNDYVDYDKYGR